MKILTYLTNCVITFLIPLSLFSQDLQKVYVESEIYKIEYSSYLEQPLNVKYTVLCPKGGVSRDGMDFWKPLQAGLLTSDNADYRNNEWDKGHMAPAAAFNCTEEMLKTTFSYANSALQHESLNRGVWRMLEEFERNLANFFTVDVEIEVLFEGEENRLPTNAVVPTGFRKSITYSDGTYSKTLLFLFPNTDTRGTDWIDYLDK